MRLIIWSFDLAFHENRLLQRISQLLIFVIWESEIFISVIRDTLNRVRESPAWPSLKSCFHVTIHCVKIKITVKRKFNIIMPSSASGQDESNSSL